MGQEPAHNRGNDARPTRPSPVRSDRRGRQALRIRTRAALGTIFATAAMLLIAFLVLARAGTAVRGLERAQYAATAAEARGRLDRLADSDRDRLIEAGFSDQLYDMVGKGPVKSDSAIRPTFADRFASRHGDQFIGIYDLAGKRLFRHLGTDHSGLDSIAATNSFFRILDNREPAVGLVRSGSRFYWVGGVPILPTSDANRSQPIRGYLVVAQPFQPKWAAPTAVSRGGRLDFEATEASKLPFPTRVDPGTTRDSARITFSLDDIYAQRTGLAIATVTRPDFLAAEGRLIWIGLLSAIVIVGLGVASFVAARRWVVAPAEMLARALNPAQHGQLPSLVAAVSSAAEWNTVTGAVNRLIANGRTAHERFERLTAAGRDGLFERDLLADEWTGNSLLCEIIGCKEGEFLTPLDALKDRLHPDSVGPIVDWLGAAQPTPATLSADTMVRRPGGTWVPIQFTAQAINDASGNPARIVGRIVDQREKHAAAVAAEAVRLGRETDLRVGGEFLRAVAALLPRLADGRGTGDYLDWIGSGMTGHLSPEPAPIDLFAMVQRLAAAMGEADLTIVPGVPDWVEGDRRMLEAAVTALLPASSGSRPALRIDQPDRNRPELIRFTVEERPDDVDSERTDRIAAALKDGHAEGANPLLECRVVHHLARALGGEAGLDRDRALLRLWIAVPLPAARAPVADAAELAAETHQQTKWEQPVTFEVERSAEAEFVLEAAPTLTEPRVELVADATVTINLDEPAVHVGSPIGAGFREALVGELPSAHGAVRVALSRVPDKLAEVRRALRTGAIKAASESAEAIAVIGESIDAPELTRAARSVIDAVENQYTESADEQFAALERSWARVDTELGTLPTALIVDSPEARGEPAIDPVTLEQLSSSLTGTGLGGQLVELFLADAPGRVEAIERAAAASDWNSLRGHAVDLKGLCGLIGAAALGATCGYAAQADGPAGLADVVAIRAEWERLQQILDGLMGARTGA